MKRSSDTSATDAGFLQRAGGAEQTVEGVKRHYKAKYSADNPTPLIPLIDKLRGKHGQARANPITTREILTHLSKLNSQTCTGEDGVPYTLLREITVSDLRESFCEFLNGILYSGQVPSEWKWDVSVLSPKLNCLAI